MTALRIGYLSAFLRRQPAVRRPNRPEDPGADMGNRFLAALGGRHQGQAPPLSQLSNHLRRDIGLPPVHRPHDWRWHR